MWRYLWNLPWEWNTYSNPSRPSWSQPWPLFMSMSMSKISILTSKYISFFSKHWNWPLTHSLVGNGHKNRCHRPIWRSGINLGYSTFYYLNHQIFKTTISPISHHHSSRFHFQIFLSILHVWNGNRSVPGILAFHILFISTGYVKIPIFRGSKLFSNPTSLVPHSVS